MKRIFLILIVVIVCIANSTAQVGIGTTTPHSGNNPYYRQLQYNSAGVSEVNSLKVFGCSVRCVKD